MKKSIPCPPGDYKINFSVTDLTNNRQTLRTSYSYIPDPQEEISHVTNIRVFTKETEEKDGYGPVTTYDLSNSSDSIKFVFQITNNIPDEPITINSRLLKFKSDTTIARPMSWPNYNASHIAYKGVQYKKFDVVSSSSRIIGQEGSVSIEFFFPKLKRGNYRFEVTTNDGEIFKARDFSVKSKNYPSLKTAIELAAPLYYLMSKKEYKHLMSLDDEVEIKKTIDRFWLKNIKNSKKARNVISLYYERVEEANKQFANQKEGWKTDMGMVYILFGAPWYEFKSLDEIKWSYSHDLYDFENNFFFKAPKMKNRYFPFESYLLIRSNQYFSIQYSQTQKWLSGAILKDNL